MVAYTYVRGYAMVAADPIGPPEDIGRGRSTSSSPSAPSAAGGSRSSPCARPTTPLYRERGMHAIYLGDEAIIRCDGFSLEGAGMKAVRAAVKRVGKRPQLRADRARPRRARS